MLKNPYLMAVIDKAMETGDFSKVWRDWPYTGVLWTIDEDMVTFYYFQWTQVTES